PPQGLGEFTGNAVLDSEKQAESAARLKNPGDCVPMALPVLEWNPRSVYLQSQWHKRLTTFHLLF
ncbi:MAG: hypothetical protein N2C14_25835, partial [Planctomycetales bacterium]